MISFYMLGFGFVSAIAIFIYKLRQTTMYKNMMYVMNYNNMGFLGIVADNINESKNRLDELPMKKGEVAVVTGGSRGIGVHIVRTLAKCGMHVVMGVRDIDAAKKLVEEFTKENLSGTFSLLNLDVSSLRSVAAFSMNVNKEYPEVHLLVNNAGILHGDFTLTADGFERQLATNYIGHFYLTHLLLNNMKRAGEKSGKCARIVNVSSCMHYGAEIDFDDIHMKKSYSPTGGYARSKLAQLMFTRSLNRTLEEDGLPVRCYAAHPGLVATDMFYNSSGGKATPWLDKFMKKPEQGAIPILHCCLSSKLENNGGAYISNGEEGYSTSYSRNVEHQKRLFKATCEMVNVSKFGILK